MAIYVLREGRMVDKATGEPMNPAPVEGAFPCPNVCADIEAYQSPVDGTYVSGRRAKRDDLKRTNCIDAADMPTLGGKLKNERFAKKWGMTERLIEK